MTVTEWFGKQDLGLKYGIVLGSLIFVTVVFGVCKLIYIKRRVKKFEKEAEIAQSERREELWVLNQKVEEEGDLFGIRALEKGFFGGVAQSRPATPASIGSSTLAPPRSAHLSHRPSSELGHPAPMHRTPAVGHVSGLHGSAEMHSVLPQTPTTVHRPDHSRSPSPTASTNSQNSTVNAELPTRVLSGPHTQVYSNSPLSLRN